MMLTVTIEKGVIARIEGEANGNDFKNALGLPAKDKQEVVDLFKKLYDTKADETTLTIVVDEKEVEPTTTAGV